MARANRQPVWVPQYPGRALAGAGGGDAAGRLSRRACLANDRGRSHERRRDARADLSTPTGGDDAGAREYGGSSMTRFVVRPMRYEDIDAVSEVERECFSTPWPTSAYRRELRDNRLGRYIVLIEVREEGEPLLPPERQSDEPGGNVLRAVGQLLRP